MSQGVITTNELFPHDTWRTHIQTSSCLTSLGGCDSVTCLPTGRNRRRPVMLLTNSGRPAGDSIGSQCHYLCRGIRGACMPLLCPLHPLLCPFYAYPPPPLEDAWTTSRSDSELKIPRKQWRMPSSGSLPYRHADTCLLLKNRPALFTSELEGIAEI